MRADIRAEIRLVAIATCLALFAGTLWPESLNVPLEYQRRAVLDGELWRLWTGHLVHFSAGQALWDGLACLIPAAWLWREGKGNALVCALGLAAPLIALVLLAWVPGMAVYRGASGLAVTLWVAALDLAWQRRPDLRLPMFACALLLLLKLAGEAMGWDVVLADLPAGVEVAWQAHWAGFVCGVLWVAGARLCARKQFGEAAGAWLGGDVIPQRSGR